MAEALDQFNPWDGHNQPNPNPGPEAATATEAEAKAAMIKCLNWTPLHVAASCGHLESSQIAMLNRNKELAEALDSQQRSLLHLASANGCLETVRELIRVRPEMCLARDRDGANPLHVAAMRGKVEVLDELYHTNPHAARARIDSAERETVLHLCVKYDQLPCLKNLLEKYFKGKEFVNAKDNAGNTILHLAVADRRLKLIKYIIDHTEIDVNAINASNQTAMDILRGGRRKGSKPEGDDEHIQTLLRTKDARREFFLLVDPARLAERRNGIMVAAVLMATLAFQAGVNPPGGVWPADTNGHGHRSGEAVMASSYPHTFMVFIGEVILSFSASILTLVFILLDMVCPTRIFFTLTVLTMYITMIFLVGTFLVSLQMVSPAGPPQHKPKPQVPFSDKPAIWIVISLVMVLAMIGLPIILWLWKRMRMISAEKRLEKLNGQDNQASDQRRGPTDQALVDGDNNA